MPLDRAEVRRKGADVTVVATAIMVHRALAAAERLAAEGISLEVIDLRALRPLDAPTLIESVSRTGRLLVVYEGVKTQGMGAEVSALIAESAAFDHLDAAILRLGGAVVPMPYNPDLERAAAPQEDDIVDAARRLARGAV